MALREVPRWRRWLGRSGRIEFWVTLVALFAIHFPLGVLTHSRWIHTGVTVLCWVVVTTRRLNDMRGRLWWAWAPFGLLISVALVIGLLRGLSHNVVMLPMTIATAALGLSFLIVVIYMGFAPGRRDGVDASGAALGVDVSAFD